MIEVNWGQPLPLVVTAEGDIKNISTIEQAQYWLQRKWPVSGAARLAALQKIEAAMECLESVDVARAAFIVAASEAGFSPKPLVS